jgi:DNA-binding MarR family transcriptional regulator
MADAAEKGVAKAAADGIAVTATQATPRRTPRVIDLSTPGIAAALFKNSLYVKPSIEQEVTERTEYQGNLCFLLFKHFFSVLGAGRDLLCAGLLNPHRLRLKVSATTAPAMRVFARRRAAHYRFKFEPSSAELYRDEPFTRELVRVTIYVTCFSHACQGRLAVAAANADSRGPNPSRFEATAPDQNVERTCCAAIDGRRAVRLLAEWGRPLELTEPEFQVLWRLRQASDSAVDQKTLASDLAFSAAQISASVERLRARGWILQVNAQGDRRRHLWRLSDGGQKLLDSVLVAARASTWMEAAA